MLKYFLILVAIYPLVTFSSTNRNETIDLNNPGSGSMSIGANAANANAMLDVNSTTKAFMPPRMTTTQKNAIASPTAGMIVYDSTLNSTSYYNGTSWINLVATTASVGNATDFSWQVSSAGVVSGENLDVINGNCTNANPSVCTFNSSIFTVAPNCTTTITNTATNLALTAPATSTLTTVTIQQNSSVIATQEPFVVHCQKSGTDYTNAVAGGVVASNLNGYLNVQGATTAIYFFGATVPAACSASPCTRGTTYGTNITNITRSSTGAYSLNYATLTQAPVCQVTMHAQVSQGDHCQLNNTTTTAASIACATSGAAAVDEGFAISCVGN